MTIRILRTSDNIEEIQYILKFYYEKKRKNISKDNRKSTEKICDVYWTMHSGGGINGVCSTQPALSIINMKMRKTKLQKLALPGKIGCYLIHTDDEIVCSRKPRNRSTSDEVQHASQLCICEFKTWFIDLCQVGTNLSEIVHRRWYVPLIQLDVKERKKERIRIYFMRRREHIELL